METFLNYFFSYLLIAAWIGWGYLTLYQAENQGRNKLCAFSTGLIFGPIANLVYFILGKTESKEISDRISMKLKVRRAMCEQENF